MREPQTTPLPGVMGLRGYEGARAALPPQCLFLCSPQLSLCSNRIDVAGAENLVKALAAKSTLEKVYCGRHDLWRGK